MLLLHVAASCTHLLLCPLPLKCGRLGRPSSRPRLLSVYFTSLEEKHALLKHAKTLRQAGIRCDDYLTRQQQQERQVLSEDFTALKAKGHKPFFRGSELKYYYAGKMHNCKQSQAQKAPSAKSPFLV